MAKSCSIEGCGRVHYGVGLCRPHYKAEYDMANAGRIAAYEKKRRQDPKRREAERRRNRGRRSYINAWNRVKGFDRYVEAVRREEIFERDGYRCQICRRKTKGKWPDPRSATLDHIVPLSKGGEHVSENLQCACWRCNHHKAAGAANDQLRLRIL